MPRLLHRRPTLRQDFGVGRIQTDNIWTFGGVSRTAGYRDAANYINYSTLTKGLQGQRRRVMSNRHQVVAGAVDRYQVATLTPIDYHLKLSPREVKNELGTLIVCDGGNQNRQRYYFEHNAIRIHNIVGSCGQSRYVDVGNR